MISTSGKAVFGTRGHQESGQQKPRFLATLGTTRVSFRRSRLRATVCSSVPGKRQFRRAFWAARYGRQEIEKRSFNLLGGPCFEGTLRKFMLSESSPVAGTIENLICSLES